VSAHGEKRKGDLGDREVYVISVAAEITGMHAQTLRTYDRMGLVSPERTSGGGRRYSRENIRQLMEIQRLSHDEGVNLAGIKAIIDLQQRVAALERENDGLRQQAGRRSGEIVHVPRSTAVVLWEQRRRRRGNDRDGRGTRAPGTPRAALEQ